MTLNSTDFFASNSVNVWFALRFRIPFVLEFSFSFYVSSGLISFGREACYWDGGACFREGLASTTGCEAYILELRIAPLLTEAKRELYLLKLESLFSGEDFLSIRFTWLYSLMLCAPGLFVSGAAYIVCSWEFPSTLVKLLLANFKLSSLSLPIIPGVAAFLCC